jgi:hypothetical protein
MPVPGTQFTCFTSTSTGTKVQILTPEELARDVYDELYVEEITESLARYSNDSDKERFRSVGLIVAADVFVYSGALDGVFASALLLLYYCFTSALLLLYYCVYR